MKKNITLLFVIFTILGAHAQVIFEHDFESGLAPMINVEKTGFTAHPNVAAFASGWTVAEPAWGNGTNIAVSTSWFQPAGRADVWLISPKIAITDARTVVTWSAKAQDASFRDGYQVRVSRTSAETEDFEDVLVTVNQENVDFTERVASLADYVGDSIHIAWRNNSNDMFLLAVDDISVRVIKENSVTLSSLAIDQYHLTGDQVEIAGIVENRGSNPINYLELTWSNEGESYTDTLSDIDIAVGSTFEFTHSALFTIPESRSYSIDVLIENPNNADTSEIEVGLLTTVVSGVSEAVQKRIVFEEGTGTWCGWCPRGFVGMEYMLETYPESFIGIAVHNGDPMVVSVHDNNIGVSGYPSSNVDRTLLDVAVSASAWEGFHNSQLRFVSPVDVDLEANYSEEGRSVSIEAKATFYTELNDEDFRFSVVMLEDSIRGTSANYAQVNFYSFQSANLPLVGYGFDWQAEPDPVPASRMYYNDVSRAILGGYNGQPGQFPAEIAVGQEVTQTFNYTVPASFNPANMRAVVLLLDGKTGRIINANEKHLDILLDVEPVEVVQHLSLYPNPASSVVHVDLELERPSAVQLNIVNALGQVIARHDLGSVSNYINTPVNIQDFAPGVYSFVFHMDGQVVNRQVVIK